MAKEYFSHDYRAREDLKMKKLFIDKGLKGIGLYWCIVEMLYENNGFISLNEISVIAFDFRTNKQFVESVVKDYQLFKDDGEKFYSESILKRLQIREEKAETARQKALKRWDKMPNESNSNTTAMPQHNNGNAELCKYKDKYKEKDKKEIKEYKKESVREKSIYAQQNFFDTHPNIMVETLPGNITEIDFNLLSEKIENSKTLKSRTSFSWLCKEWSRIKEGYYDDFKTDKPPQQTRRAMRDL